MSNLASVRDLGAIINGLPVQEITLKHQNAAITVLTYGATLQRFEIGIPGFEKRDVVLGYADWRSYVASFNEPPIAFIGAIVGPIAGRVANAQIPWKNSTWNFEPNEGQHLLHGGNSCYSNVNWTLAAIESEPQPSATFLLESHPEMQLPGALLTKVKYTLFDFELRIEIETTALEATLSNPTQHGYFNPNGHEGSILDTDVFIQSAAFLELNDDKLPTGKVVGLMGFLEEEGEEEELKLEKKEKDLKKAKAEKKEYHSLIPLYSILDHAFLLNGQDEQAILEAKDGFQLKFTTNQPVFQIYVGGQTTALGKHNETYHRYSGICLEQQAEPDAPHHENFSDIYLSKGEIRNNTLSINFQQH
jgi:aldose 1-epimerase